MFLMYKRGILVSKTQVLSVAVAVLKATASRCGSLLKLYSIECKYLNKEMNQSIQRYS